MGFDFVAHLLSHEDAVTAQSAAIALGDSRHDAAFPPLSARLEEETRPDVRRTLAFALAGLRLDESVELLLQLAEHGSREDSAAAAEALDLCPGEALRERLRAALARRKGGHVPGRGR